MPRKKHICDLDLGSDSMLPKKKTACGRALRNLTKLGQLSMHHPDTFKYFRSYSAVVAERQRQLLEEGGRVIHPLSILNMFWMSFMILVNLGHMTMSTLRLFFILQPMQSLNNIHFLDLALLGPYAICIIDIVMKLNTGYIDKKYAQIVMTRKSIFCRYLRRWLLLDIATSLPIAIILMYRNCQPRFVLIGHLLPILRTVRIYTVSVDMKKTMKIFTESYIVHGILRIVVLFVLTTHWCNCLMYGPAVIIYYWTGEMPTEYNYYMRLQGSSNLLHHDINTRYNKAIVIAISSFVGTGLTMFRSSEPAEILIHSCIIFYAAMFMVFSLLFLLKSYLTIFASTVRYQGLMNQVEEYMQYRQFPPSLMKRVRMFYEYRYQERYFKEDSDLDCLSEELRDEIALHTCRTIIYKVKLFEDMPASVVGTILGCLRPEVYLANDLVVRAGDIGDCMYFIATGTVAVYSLKGVEVCHLEDGTHFGEVALLMKDSKRVATVVAVETTQLYRLDVHDFNCFMLTHTTLYERIGALASMRMNETVLLDDEFHHVHHSSSDDHSI